MLKRVSKILFVLISLLTAFSVHAQSGECYLLKVNIWPRSAMTPEMIQAVNDQKFPQLSSKYGAQLRALADGTPTNSTCTDIKNGTVNDVATINTGSVKRSSVSYTVTVAYGLPAIDLEAKAVNGIAGFYFDQTRRLVIRIKDMEGKIIAPKTGFITFDASEWHNDPGHVMNVHFFVVN